MGATLGDAVIVSRRWTSSLGLVVTLLAGCSESHGRLDGAAIGLDAGAPSDGGGSIADGGRPIDAPDACVERRADPVPPTDLMCTSIGVIPCVGEQYFLTEACPICPAVPGEEGPCSVEGYQCLYSGPGWCNFSGCDCMADATGALRWTCWAPLC